MGVWYFLILFVGLFFVIKGIFMRKQSLLIKKISFVFVGYYVFHAQYLCFRQVVQK